MAADNTKPLFWVGSAKECLLGFPDEVRREVGYALYLAQTGRKHLNAKPLRGFGGAGVLEVIEDHASACAARGNTTRP